ncbi:hypothetical protein BDE02_17G037200 [Populus trichocarpa]|nr:hypothetical protein BDE02_17G037200 [Populus trichocarpa]
MASRKSFILAFFIALAFSSMTVSLAARHLLQLPTLPPLPSIPNLPQPQCPPYLQLSHHYQSQHYLHFLASLQSLPFLQSQRSLSLLFQACPQSPQFQLSPLFHSFPLPLQLALDFLNPSFSSNSLPFCSSFLVMQDVQKYFMFLFEGILFVFSYLGSNGGL